MALTPAERMRRYRAKKAGGKTDEGQNLNKSAKLYLDEEAQALIALLKCEAQNESLEQLFKRALLALSQTHFDALLSSDLTEEAVAENIEVTSENNDTLLATMNQLQGKILLLESEYITPLKETVRQLQKKKAQLLQQIDKLKQQNKRLRKTALHFRQQRDAALQNKPSNHAPDHAPSHAAGEEKAEIEVAVDTEALLQQMAMPTPGAAHSEQRQVFLQWLKAQRRASYGWTEIAEVLNQANIPTPSGKSQWSASLLRNLLKRA